MSKAKGFASKIVALVLVLVLVLQPIAVFAEEYFADAEKNVEDIYDSEMEVIDLTGVLYGQDNILTQEEVDAILADAVDAEALDAQEEQALAVDEYDELEYFDDFSFSTFQFVPASGTTTIAAWSFADNPAVNAAAVSGRRGINSSTGNAVLEFYVGGTTRVLRGGSSAINVRNALDTGVLPADGGDGGLDGQANNAWWQTRISTTGLTGIELGWNMRSTNAGPQDWRLEYRIGATGTWTSVYSFALVNDGGANPTIDFAANRRNGIELPATVDNQPLVYIRWIMTSNTPVGTGASVTAVGTHQINHVSIAATDVYASIVSIANANTIANAPVATAQEVTVQGWVSGVGMQLNGTSDNANLFIQDGTGETDGILVWGSGRNLSSYVGQWVEVTGLRTAFQTNRNQIQIGTTASPTGSISVVPHGSRPEYFEPVEVEIDDLFAGEYFAMLVTLEDVEFGHNSNRADFLTAAGVNTTAAPSGTGHQSHFVIDGNGRRVELRQSDETSVAGLATDDPINVVAVISWNNVRGAVQLINAEVEELTTTPTVLPVTASPASGATLPTAGGTVTLTSATTAAEIRYSLNGGTTWSTSATNTATVTIIESDFVSGTVTIQAYARVDSDVSTTATFTYNQYQQTNITTIAAWEFETNPAVNAARTLGDTAVRASSGDPNALLRFFENGTARILVGGSSAINAGAGYDAAYLNRWQTQVNTIGLADIEISWRMRSTTTGPRDWRLEYSTNGSIWHNVEDVQITNNAGANVDIDFAANHFSATLPATANNQPELFLRWVMTSAINVNGGTSLAGTHQINDIIIIAADEVYPPAIHPVTVDIPSGTMLPLSGGNITLSSLTTGAEVRYNINNAGWQTASSNPAIITIDTFAGGVATVQAYAIYNSIASVTRTFTYQEFRALTVPEARQAPLGEVVTVRGIVTNIYETTAGNNNSFFLQDPTSTCELSGIHVRLVAANTEVTGAGGASNFVGHLVEVTGVRQRPTATNGFQGVDNIMTAGVGHGVTIIEQNVTLPAVVPVQLADLVAPAGSSRPYSSMMVSIERAVVSRDTSGPSNFILLDPNTGNALSIGGNTFIVNPLPVDIQTGDLVSIHRANVHWWAGRSEIQLRLINVATDIEKLDALTDVVANPLTGATLPIGGTVTLSAQPDDARIYFSVNGGIEQLSTSNTVEVTIPAFDQAGDTAVIVAHSVLPDGQGGYEDTTAPRTFTYTQAQAADVVSSHMSGTVRPGTEITLQTATEAADIFYVLTTNVGAGNQQIHAEALFDGSILLADGMFPVRVEAFARAVNYLDSDTLTIDFTARIIGGEQIFFGQLHAHTTMSDGAGTPEMAFAEARNVAGLDFFALSDHSNAFYAGFVSGTSGARASNADGPDVFNLREYQQFGSSQWDRGRAAAQAATTPDFLAINGFEFTWTGNSGHVNTFNTTGWVGRQNTYLNEQTGFLGVQRYYELLRNTPESITMFNHPGRTFGNFNNFAFFDPQVALRIPLLEVTNGEGAIGSGGFFPSYEQFSLALDRGWLVAPVSSQDNHRGRFGWSNEGRVAIYTNDFSMDGLWQAFRDRAVYSTEIRDMEIRFYANGMPMGTVVHNMPSVANFNATVYVPAIPRVRGTGINERDTYTIRRISLITNGGVEIPDSVQTFNAPVGVEAVYDFSIINPVPGYYYLWVLAENSRGQQRIGVTAPIWMGRAPVVGVTEVTTETFMPVTGRELTITTELFNDENEDVRLVAIQYILGGQVIQTVSYNRIIPGGSSSFVNFDFTPSAQGINSFVVRALIEIDGVTRQSDGFIDLNVRDINAVSFIGIDGAHFNDYVTGGTSNSFTNFAMVAAEYNLVTEVLRTEQALIDAASDPDFVMLLISSPGRQGSIITDPARGEHRNFSQATIDAVADFVERGGTVAIAGFGNFNETGGTIPGLEGSNNFQLNRLLAAIGSNIRIGDTSHSAPVGFRDPAAHQHLLRYRENFNLSNPFMAGIIPFEDDAFGNGQLYRNFSTGALYVVNNPTALVRDASDVASYVVSDSFPIGVDPMVFAHPGSWTVDSNGGAGGNQGAGRIKFPTPGAAFPRYAHPLTGMAPAPSTGTGDGQRPAAGGTAAGQHLIAASQNLGDGTVLVFASMFFSNFDVRAELDNAAQLPNANLTISQNIFESVAREIEITDIADVHAANNGEWFTIQGVVMSGLQLTGADSAENRGFINSIYIQDATGGINLFQITEGNAAGLQVGQIVRATGYVSEYQGERQLTVHLGGRFQIIDPRPIHPHSINHFEINQIVQGIRRGDFGRVVGVVSDIIYNPGTDILLQFTITDDTGSVPVYMRSYITPTVDISFVEEGATVEVWGFNSHGELADGIGPRVRVRDRNEIALIQPPTPQLPSGWVTFEYINFPLTRTATRNEVVPMHIRVHVGEEAFEKGTHMTVSWVRVGDDNLFINQLRNNTTVISLDEIAERGYFDAQTELPRGTHAERGGDWYLIVQIEIPPPLGEDGLWELLAGDFSRTSSLTITTPSGETPSGGGGTPTTPQRPVAPQPEPTLPADNHTYVIEQLENEETQIVFELPEDVTELRLYESTLETLTDAEAVLVIQTENTTVTLPTNALDAIRYAAINLEMESEEYVVIIIDTTPEEAYVVVDFAVAISRAGSELEIIETFATPVTVEVNVGDLFSEETNPYRFIAVNENGDIVGGSLNPEPGVFTFETNVSSSFTIQYVEDLRRIHMNLNSSDIMDVAQGYSVTMDVLPILQNGRTLIPLRFVAEMLGASVSWSDDTQEVTMVLNGEVLVFAIGETLPGMDVPAQLIDARTYVPLRFVVEFFGAWVAFDPETQGIEIIL